LDKILYAVYLNNAILNYIIFLLSLILSITAIKIVENILIKRFNAWAGNAKTLVHDQLIRSLHKKLIPILYWASFRISAKILNLNTMLEDTLKLISIAFAIAIGVIISRFQNHRFF